MAQGRGRLNSLQLLPRECSPIVQWAAAELRETNRNQTDIYKEFAEQLEALQREYRGELEFSIPSRSAFNRYSVALDADIREMREIRETTRAIAGTFDPDERDETTKVAVEMLKGAIYTTYRARRGKIDEKGLQALSNALKALLQAESLSQSTSTRQKLQAELAAKVKEVSDVVSKAGISKETMDAINRRLGVI